MAHIEYATVEDILNYFGKFYIFLDRAKHLLSIDILLYTKCYNFYNTWINDMPCFAVEIYNEVFSLLIDKI